MLFTSLDDIALLSRTCPTQAPTNNFCGIQKPCRSPELPLQFLYFALASAFMMSAVRQASAIAGALVFPDIGTGIEEQSTTLSRSTPRTRI